jgi:hypothetical protein
VSLNCDDAVFYALDMVLGVKIPRESGVMDYYDSTHVSHCHTRQYIRFCLLFMFFSSNWVRASAALNDSWQPDATEFRTSLPISHFQFLSNFSPLIHPHSIQLKTKQNATSHQSSPRHRRHPRGSQRRREGPLPLHRSRDSQRNGKYPPSCCSRY